MQHEETVKERKKKERIIGYSEKMIAAWMTDKIFKYSKEGDISNIAGMLSHVKADH